MSKANLEFAIDIEAEEALLKKIQDALSNTESPLAVAVIDLIQEKISAGYEADDFKVNLLTDKIKLKTLLDGGLSAQEWLEQSDLSDEPAHQQMSHPGFHD